MKSLREKLRDYPFIIYIAGIVTGIFLKEESKDTSQKYPAPPPYSLSSPSPNPQLFDSLPGVKEHYRTYLKASARNHSIGIIFVSDDFPGDDFTQGAPFYIVYYNKSLLGAAVNLFNSNTYSLAGVRAVFDKIPDSDKKVFFSTLEALESIPSHIAEKKITFTEFYVMLTGLRDTALKLEAATGKKKEVLLQNFYDNLQPPPEAQHSAENLPNSAWQRRLALTENSAQLSSNIKA